MPLYPLYVGPSSTSTWVTYTQTSSGTTTPLQVPTAQQVYRWYMRAVENMPVWAGSTLPTPTLTVPTMVWYNEWADYDDPQMPINTPAGTPPNPWVPYTPAIIRRLGDRHEREELARADLATREAARQAEVARRSALQAANDRARELLLAHLTDVQRETFEKNNWFVVEGGKSKQRYRIHVDRGYSANIEVIGKGHRLCAHLACDLPFGDQILAQKVSLELDEEHFVRTANVHPGRGYP